MKWKRSMRMGKARFMDLMMAYMLHPLKQVMGKARFMDLMASGVAKDVAQ
jgi:hypothetical protein